MLSQSKQILPVLTLQCQQQRGMANLKIIGLRLKSVKNIQKITQSMKMVSAAKFARAERDLKSARPLGAAAKAFYDHAEISTDKEEPKELYLAMTSDRGLAGAVHSNIGKSIRAELAAERAAEAAQAAQAAEVAAQMQRSLFRVRHRSASGQTNSDRKSVV